MLLYDGRASSFRELLVGSHGPAKVSGSVEFSENEITDLVAYLETL